MYSYNNYVFGFIACFFCLVIMSLNVLITCFLFIKFLFSCNNYVFNNCDICHCDTVLLWYIYIYYSVIHIIVILL